MPLTIFTNEREGIKHGGNPDRDDPSRTYDRPEKLEGTIRAARALVDVQARAAGVGGEINLASELLRMGTKAPVEPISMKESLRVPTDAELCLAHTPEYLARFREIARQAKLNPGFHDFGPEAQVSAGTYEAALSAVGATLEMVDHVLCKPGSTGFALVWPPGHHAEPHQAMGFCYFNNAAIAALYARDHDIPPGREPRRVLVIDVDHHTGNGTRLALANQSNILLIDMDYEAPYDEALGQYTDHDIDPVTGERSNSGKEYPYRRDDHSIGARAHPITQADNIIEIRSAKGPSENPNPGELMELFLDRSLPRIKEFKPDVVIWSLGIDSAMGDALGGLGHVPGSFYTMLRGLRLLLPEASHAGVLEGGYDEDNWKRVLPACLYALHHAADDPMNHSEFFGQRRLLFIQD